MTVNEIEGKTCLIYWVRKTSHLLEKRKLKEIDFNQLDTIYKVYLKEEIAIDHTTWHDLDLNNVFSTINYTVTTPGEERLYRWLKNPMDNEKTLQERIDYLGNFQEEKIYLTEIKKKNLLR